MKYLFFGLLKCFKKQICNICFLLSWWQVDLQTISVLSSTECMPRLELFYFLSLAYKFISEDRVQVFPGLNAEHAFFNFLLKQTSSNFLKFSYSVIYDKFDYTLMSESTFSCCFQWSPPPLRKYLDVEAITITAQWLCL